MPVGLVSIVTHVLLMAYDCHCAPLNAASVERCGRSRHLSDGERDKRTVTPRSHLAA